MIKRQQVGETTENSRGEIVSTNMEEELILEEIVIELEK